MPSSHQSEFNISAFMRAFLVVLTKTKLSLSDKFFLHDHHIELMIHAVGAKL